MVNYEKQQSLGDREIEDVDLVDLAEGGDFDDSSDVEAFEAGTSGESGRSGDGELAERLTEILMAGGDGDLLLAQSGPEVRVLQFLQALDLQILGACRADERLKPLLKLNVSCDAAEDRLLAHLSQHFEPSEVGMLARCLCIPLVSIRVGKITKQGTLLCPTATRGILNLTLLPTSDLRISFIADSGHTERLSTLSSDSQCSAVIIEGIPADKSGRSFLIKIPNGETLYFWCSEKSKLLGDELLSKMKDLLKKKPSLAELTGISESRLDSFATHLKAYLVGSSVTKTQASSAVTVTLPSDLSSDISAPCRNATISSSLASKSLRVRPCGSQSGRVIQCQGSLSPRSSSFKEGLPRNFSSLRNVAREILKRCDGQLSAAEKLAVASPVASDASTPSSSGKDKLPETPIKNSFADLSGSPGKSAFPPFLSPTSQVNSVASTLLSPYYCWCPPIASTLQYTVAPPQLPISLSDSLSLSLPPLSSMLPPTRSSSVLTPASPFNVAQIPPIDFPPLLPEPLVRLPISRSSSQQIPTFTPLICDPIVHIPVIDVCSSGQGYLVSAGPAISTTLPPLLPKLVNPLIPESNSVIEEGARETLRLLISGSSQSNPPLMSVLPSVLAGSDSYDNPSILAAGSRGLYSGSRDVAVGAIATSIAAMGLISLPEESVVGSVIKRCVTRGGSLEDRMEKPRSGANEDEDEDEGSSSSTSKMMGGRVN
ncbi:LOW QUALITY PROTEIN: uncharacterized protein LOC127801799 [Diospyros lotus]|uniref:LOW QUALITY PROTEIN: uncharacterized protein LOC127801799 n=1 Tax=Diospyros lotus TaxID=55363 RepID=UPI002250A745|nr:LOW QUALITY PROTEIN: uncharacterized protein LOC127801799 [Diospyros lotus]